MHKNMHISRLLDVIQWIHLTVHVHAQDPDLSALVALYQEVPSARGSPEEEFVNMSNNS
jgi:hypothetical protein